MTPPQDNFGPRSQAARFVAWLLCAIAIVYAFLCGFHTVQDFDLGWQLATGRWVVQNHRVFSADVFSHTAAGQPWIYPAFSGVIFYLAHLSGGYALLTWLGALASAGTVALLLRKNSLATAALALLAAPLIANRTQPRAEMFTAILFAVFLALLWRHYRTGRSPLWLLPVFMMLWVNLHLGFPAGLALCAGYVLLEALDMPSRSKRRDALNRLRHAGPWLAVTAAATLINPWGWSIYSALARQQQAQALHNTWLVEWQAITVSSASLHQALDWRDPQSGFWWLVAGAPVFACIALWRKQWGAAVWLSASTYLAFQHLRLQALFACVAVVVGGSIVSDVASDLGWTAAKQSADKKTSGQIKTAGSMVLILALIALAAFRSSDLISNRYYMKSSQLAVFGPGRSWWFPERAVDFVQREKLPGNIFNGYALGGYLTWRLFPAYPDYIDSRALPFGPDLFFHAYDLAAEPPDSAAWRQEAEARNINTIIVPLSRYQGMSLFSQLPAFCRAQSWRAVYLDEVSAVFVRVTPQTAALVAPLSIDCGKVPFEPRSASSPVTQFNFWANAGGVLYSLERYPEALADLDRAVAIAQDNASVHLLRALVLQQLGRAAEAEPEFRTSLTLEPSDTGWFDFGLFYMSQKRFAEAADIFRRSAESSSRPHEMWMMLGQAYVQSRQPQLALEAFDKAVASSPFGENDASLGASFNSLIAAGRASAWYQLGDVSQAVSFQEEAVRLAPEDKALWQGLADVYEVQGRTTKAAEARAHADVR